MFRVFLGYYAVSTGKYLVTFRKIVVPSSLVSSSPRRDCPARTEGEWGLLEIVVSFFGPCGVDS
jgi:hypothetical protein